MTTRSEHSVSLVLRRSDGREAPVTNFSLTGKNISVWGDDIEATFPIELSPEPSGDCDNTGHRWSRWTGYVVSDTDFSDGLYHTIRTPWQTRQCLDCGFTQIRVTLVGVC